MSNRYMRPVLGVTHVDVCLREVDPSRPIDEDLEARVTDAMFEAGAVEVCRYGEITATFAFDAPPQQWERVELLRTVEQAMRKATREYEKAAREESDEQQDV